MAELEYIWVGVDDPAAPPVVFLHEGLGSVAMWKDFPAKLCVTGGLRGLVYSRAGHGRSTPRPHELAECGHSVHRDQPDAVIRAAIEFIRSSRSGWR